MIKTTEFQHQYSKHRKNVFIEKAKSHSYLFSSHKGFQFNLSLKKK